MRGMRVLATSAIALALMTTIVGQSTEERGRIDPQSAERAADSVYDLIRSTVEKAGGDLSRDSIHLVFGFSTGHFAKDPLRAEAARMTAQNLADRLLVVGDKFSVFAWEMDLWEHTLEPHWGVEVTSNGPEVVTTFSNVLPLSPMKGSVGGHDTEHAIVEALDRLSGDGNVVLVLLTNDAASVVGRAGQRLIGSNDPRYREWMGRVERAPSVNEGGASIVLNYTAYLPTGGAVERTVEAIVLARKPFVAAPLSEPRPDRVIRTAAAEPEPEPAPAEPEPVPEREAHGSSGSGWLPILGGLIVLGLLAYFFYKQVPK
ncbi:MAG: hypothetical protein D6724_04275, partial [Armatimonadetes bacterium]